MSEYSFTLPDAASTEAHGRQLATLLQAGDTLLLYGDLGMGKTTLSRGIISGLSPATTEVVSPTFTLVQTYDTPQGMLYHYDLYRLKDDNPRAIVELGWEDSRLNGLILAEWPERLGDLTPEDALCIHLEACSSGGRLLRYRGNPAWLKRLEKLK